MSESHGPEHHSGLNTRAYLVVFGALSIFTALSFVVNSFVRGGSISAHTGLVLLLGECRGYLVLDGMPGNRRSADADMGVAAAGEQSSGHHRDNGSQNAPFPM